MRAQERRRYIRELESHLVAVQQAHQNVIANALGSELTCESCSQLEGLNGQIIRLLEAISFQKAELRKLESLDSMLNTL